VATYGGPLSTNPNRLSSAVVLYTPDGGTATGHCLLGLRPELSGGPVAEGQTNKEIAAQVFLSDKTLKNYVSSILAKLNLHRRAQAAAYVARHRFPGDE
jgi:hypothetical protein